MFIHAKYFAEIQGSIYMCLQKVSKYVEVLILLN